MTDYSHLVGKMVLVKTGLIPFDKNRSADYVGFIESIGDESMIIRSSYFEKNIIIEKSDIISIQELVVKEGE